MNEKEINVVIFRLYLGGPGSVFRDTGIYILFKGIWDTFENFEWNFRDIRIQRLLNFRDICSLCYMILRIFFEIISGIPGGHLPGSHLRGV